jgi:hypothetical protein
VVNAFKGTEPGAISAAMAIKGSKIVSVIKFVLFNRAKTPADPSKRPTINDLETITYARGEDGIFRPLNPKHAEE